MQKISPSEPGMITWIARHRGRRLFDFVELRRALSSPGRSRLFGGTQRCVVCGRVATREDTCSVRSIF